MKRVNMAVAAAAFASASLLSIGWSAQQGVSLSVDAAQAAPHHATMHGHYRHRGMNPVAAGADMAAGAVGTAAAIATAPFGGPNYGGGYYASSSWGDYECRGGSAGCRPNAQKWASSGPSMDGGRRDRSRVGGRGVSRKPAG